MGRLRRRRTENGDWTFGMRKGGTSVLPRTRRVSHDDPYRALYHPHARCRFGRGSASTSYAASLGCTVMPIPHLCLVRGIVLCGTRHVSMRPWTFVHALVLISWNTCGRFYFLLGGALDTVFRGHALSARDDTCLVGSLPLV